MTYLPFIQRYGRKWKILFDDYNSNTGFIKLKIEVTCKKTSSSKQILFILNKCCLISFIKPHKTQISVFSAVAKK